MNQETQQSVARNYIAEVEQLVHANALLQTEIYKLHEQLRYARAAFMMIKLPKKLKHDYMEIIADRRLKRTERRLDAETARRVMADNLKTASAQELDAYQENTVSP